MCIELALQLLAWAENVQEEEEEKQQRRMFDVVVVLVVLDSVLKKRLNELKKATKFVLYLALSLPR